MTVVAGGPMVVRRGGGGLGGLKVLAGAAFGLIETLLVGRFVLCLVRADPENRVVEVWGTITDPLVRPFEGVLGIQHVAVGGETHGAFDAGALVAMAGYGLLFALIFAILSLASRRNLV